MCAMVGVNELRSKLFIFPRSIHQFCPPFTMFALEPFLCKLMTNLVLGTITLTSAIPYADISMPVISCIKIEEIKRNLDIRDVTGAKINCNKSVWSVETFSAPGALQLDGLAMQDAQHLVSYQPPAGEKSFWRS